MGLSWPSLGRWTSRRARPSSASLEPLRGVPDGRATTTTVCYSPNGGGTQSASPSGSETCHETTTTTLSSSPPSSPAGEHQRSPTGHFGVRTCGVEETQALAKGARGRKRVRASGRGRFPLLGAGGEGKRRRLRGRSGTAAGESSITKTTDITTTSSGRANRRASENGLTGREGPGAWRRSPAATEKVPRLPRLCFPEFGLMMEEAGIPATIEGSASTPVHGEDIDVEGTSDESMLSKDRPPSGLLVSRDNDGTGGQEGPERPTKGGPKTYRPTSDEFGGRQMDKEKEEASHGPSDDIPRPDTGLGWYEDDGSSARSTADPFDSRSSGRSSDESAESTTEVSQHLPAQPDPLRCSPFVRCRSQASSLPAVGDTSTTEKPKLGKPSPPMSTAVENTGSFFQSSTEDDDWLGPRPVGSGSVSHQHVEYSPVHAEPSSVHIMDDSNPISPTSPGSFPISREEQEIDDLLDIYATFPDRTSTPSATPVRHGDLPPYPPYHPSASAPLLAIARGLSLPPTTPFAELQEHLARNANILRYLVLHCVPSPSINPVEYVTDLVEPVLPLPPPLPPHSSLAQNRPPHPRRREYTRLLQAVRSVLWSADAINDMLAAVDPDPSSSSSSSPPGGRGRPSTALPMFRKLRAADARRKGCLTSAQLHGLRRRGVSLLDVLQMSDVPGVVARGLAGRLAEAAESGVLEIAREGNLLDEEGALLELLADPDDAAVPTSPHPGNEARGGRLRRGGSGLRNCVGVDEDDGETTGDDSEGHGAETAVEPLVGDGDGIYDMSYTVSPLSPDANPGERGWDHHDVSPLTTSSRLEELEALFREARALSPEQKRPADEAAATTPDRQPRKTLGRARMLWTCGDRGGVLVDEETAKSPEMQRFFHEIGAAAADSDSDSRLAKGGRRSWGVSLGGILSA
ncbi:hypothetical protein LX32DRAFT_595352 [Colletotrichum zoysiae]|uniref:Uncharacterized protein n=1 Tax=Colletotrichum zoysiae TaxID=1216348 RepID=A0AAD9M256_9PEZI|nr:hypothetical protein LX32DRAFT_595352 [Colletotrichum zoysiae]